MMHIHAKGTRNVGLLSTGKQYRSLDLFVFSVTVSRTFQSVENDVRYDICVQGRNFLVAAFSQWPSISCTDGRMQSFGTKAKTSWLCVYMAIATACATRYLVKTTSLSARNLGNGLPLTYDFLVDSHTICPPLAGTLVGPLGWGRIRDFV